MSKDPRSPYTLIDGDTVDVQDGHRKIRVRLNGVDTHETYKPGWKDHEPSNDYQKNSLAERQSLIQQRILDDGGSVQMTGDKGHYGRTLGRILDADGNDPTVEMVRAGIVNSSRYDSPAHAKAEWDRLSDIEQGKTFVPQNKHVRQAVEDIEWAKERGYIPNAATMDGVYLGDFGELAVNPNKGFTRVLADSTKRGMANLKTAASGLEFVVGDAIGDDKMRQRGRDELFKNLYDTKKTGKQVDSYEDIDLTSSGGMGRLADYITERVGENLPTLLPDMLATVAGAFTGATVGGPAGAMSGAVAGAMLRRQVLRSGMQKLSKEQQRLVRQEIGRRAGKRIGSNVGGVVGGASSMGAQSAGGFQGTLIEQGLEDVEGNVERVAKVGVGSAVANLAPAMILSKQLRALGLGADEATDLVGALKTAGLFTLEGGLSEIPATGISMAIESDQLVGAGGQGYSRHDYIEGILSGIAGGSGIGATTGSMKGAKDYVATKLKGRHEATTSNPENEMSDEEQQKNLEQVLAQEAVEQGNVNPADLEHEIKWQAEPESDAVEQSIPEAQNELDTVQQSVDMDSLDSPIEEDGGQPAVEVAENVIPTDQPAANETIFEDDNTVRAEDAQTISQMPIEDQEVVAEAEKTGDFTPVSDEQLIAKAREEGLDDQSIFGTPEEQTVDRNSAIVNKLIKTYPNLAREIANVPSHVALTAQSFKDWYGKEIDANSLLDLMSKENPRKDDSPVSKKKRAELNKEFADATTKPLTREGRDQLVEVLRERLSDREVKGASELFIKTVQNLADRQVPKMMLERAKNMTGSPLQKLHGLLNLMKRSESVRVRELANELRVGVEQLQWRGEDAKQSSVDDKGRKQRDELNAERLANLDKMDDSELYRLGMDTGGVNPDFVDNIGTANQTLSPKRRKALEARFNKEESTRKETLKDVNQRPAETGRDEAEKTRSEGKKSREVVNSEKKINQDKRDQVDEENENRTRGRSQDRDVVLDSEIKEQEWYQHFRHDETDEVDNKATNKDGVEVSRDKDTGALRPETQGIKADGDWVSNIYDQEAEGAITNEDMNMIPDSVSDEQLLQILEAHDVEPDVMSVNRDDLKADVIRVLREARRNDEMDGITQRLVEAFKSDETGVRAQFILRRLKNMMFANTFMNSPFTTSLLGLNMDGDGATNTRRANKARQVLGRVADRINKLTPKEDQFLDNILRDMGFDPARKEVLLKRIDSHLMKIVQGNHQVVELNGSLSRYNRILKSLGIAQSPRQTKLVQRDEKGKKKYAKGEDGKYRPKYVENSDAIADDTDPYVKKLHDAIAQLESGTGPTGKKLTDAEIAKLEDTVGQMLVRFGRLVNMTPDINSDDLTPRGQGDNKIIRKQSTDNKVVTTEKTNEDGSTYTVKSYEATKDGDAKEKERAARSRRMDASGDNKANQGEVTESGEVRNMRRLISEWGINRALRNKLSSVMEKMFPDMGGDTGFANHASEQLSAYYLKVREVAASMGMFPMFKQSREGRLPTLVNQDSLAHALGVPSRDIHTALNDANQLVEIFKKLIGEDKFNKGHYFIADTETTGVPSEVLGESVELVEFAVIEYDKGVEVGRHSVLINPGDRHLDRMSSHVTDNVIGMDAEFIKKHGVPTADAFEKGGYSRDADGNVVESDVSLNDLFDKMKSGQVVFHNAAFDVSVLNETVTSLEGSPNDLNLLNDWDVIDTLEVARQNEGKFDYAESNQTKAMQFVSIKEAVAERFKEAEHITDGLRAVMSKALQYGLQAEDGSVPKEQMSAVISHIEEVLRFAYEVMESGTDKPVDVDGEVWTGDRTLIAQVADHLVVYTDPITKREYTLTDLQETALMARRERIAAENTASRGQKSLNMELRKENYTRIAEVVSRMLNDPYIAEDLKDHLVKALDTFDPKTGKGYINTTGIKRALRHARRNGQENWIRASLADTTELYGLVQESDGIKFEIEMADGDHETILANYGLHESQYSLYVNDPTNPYDINNVDDQEVSFDAGDGPKEHNSAWASDRDVTTARRERDDAMERLVNGLGTPQDRTLVEKMLEKVLRAISADKGGFADRTLTAEIELANKALESNAKSKKAYEGRKTSVPPKTPDHLAESFGLEPGVDYPKGDFMAFHEVVSNHVRQLREERNRVESRSEAEIETEIAMMEDFVQELESALNGERYDRKAIPDVKQKHKAEDKARVEKSNESKRSGTVKPKKSKPSHRTVPVRDGRKGQSIYMPNRINKVVETFLQRALAVGKITQDIVVHDSLSTINSKDRVNPNEPAAVWIEHGRINIYVSPFVVDSRTGKTHKAESGDVIVRLAHELGHVVMEQSTDDALADTAVQSAYVDYLGKLVGDLAPFKAVYDQHAKEGKFEGTFEAWVMKYQDRLLKNMASNPSAFGLDVDKMPLDAREWYADQMGAVLLERTGVLKRNHMGQREHGLAVTIWRGIARLEALAKSVDGALRRVHRHLSGMKADERVNLFILKQLQHPRRVGLKDGQTFHYDGDGDVGKVKDAGVHYSRKLLTGMKRKVKGKMKAMYTPVDGIIRSISPQLGRLLNTRVGEEGMGFQQVSRMLREIELAKISTLFKDTKKLNKVGVDILNGVDNAETRAYKALWEGLRKRMAVHSPTVHIPTEGPIVFNMDAMQNPETRQAVEALFHEAGIGFPENFMQESENTDGQPETLIKFSPGTPYSASIFNMRINQNFELRQKLYQIGAIRPPTKADLTRYVGGIAARTAWDSTMGLTVNGKFQPSGRWLALTAKMDKNSAEYLELVQAVKGTLGQVGDYDYHRNPTIKQQKRARTRRRITNAVLTYEAWRVLMFSGVGSLPETVVGLVRTREFKGAMSGIGAILQTMASSGKRQELREIAQMFGTISDQIVIDSNQGMFADMTVEGRSKKALEILFKMNGQDAVTRWSRLASTVVAHDFMRSHALRAEQGDVRSQRYLEELGLTFDDVKAYQKLIDDNGGKAPALDPDTKNFELVANIASAVQKFTQQSVMSPNTSQVPAWMSDPRFALLSSLKKFFYYFGQQVVGGVYTEMARRRNEGSSTASLAEPMMVAMMMMMPMAFVGHELREWIKWGDTDKLPHNKLSLDELAWESFKRTGIFGPIDIPISAYERTKYESEDWTEGTGKPVAFATAMAGPVFGHIQQLYDALDNKSPAIDSLLLSTPVVSQTPQLKAYMKTNLQ